MTSFLYVHTKDRHLTSQYWLMLYNIVHRCRSGNVIEQFFKFTFKLFCNNPVIEFSLDSEVLNYHI